MNISETLTQGLALVSYNGKSIETPKDKQLNIYMGLGLWSSKKGYGLSEGLPVDVMQMLLSSTLMKAKTDEANPGKPSKIVILIADSMAINEGADKGKVAQIVQIYKRSLEPLLELLNIRKSTEIVLSSDLEKSNQYQHALRSVESSPLVKTLNKKHAAYICSQTAITRYMSTQRQVGIKVGWIYEASRKQLKDEMHDKPVKKLDELTFDDLYEKICPDSTMQYLYAKAGMKQTLHSKNTKVEEGCPYTAFAKDQPYTIQTQDRKNIGPVKPKIVRQWLDVAELCSALVQAKLVKDTFLPKDCVQKEPEKTVYNLLNHWANPPKVIEEPPDRADDRKEPEVAVAIAAAAPIRRLGE